MVVLRISKNHSAGDNMVEWSTFISNLFQAAKPYLEVRGDLLHTQVAYQNALTLMEEEGGDRGVVEPAVILHDVGWSALDPELIKSAFGIRVEGKADAEKINRVHEVEGAVIAKRILLSLCYATHLIDRITAIIERHDSGNHTASLEEQLVKDADRLWRYSEVGFWVEIERQGVSSRAYHRRLSARCEQWFFTKTALRIARQEIRKRGNEIA